MIQIKSSLVKDLAEYEYRSIYSLNLRAKGFCRSHLRDARTYAHRYSRAIVARAGIMNRLVGWALLVQCLDHGKLDEYSVNIYVRASHRRQGIGARLWEEVHAFLKATHSRGHVCIWSTPSEGFYRSVVSKRIKVKVSAKYKST